MQFDIIFLYSGGVTSKPLERQDRLHPEPVSGLNATKITDKEITLVWQPPIGDYDHFDVLYDRGFGRDRLTTNSTLVNSITIRRLRPFKNYTFSVFTISGKKYFMVFASNDANLDTFLTFPADFSIPIIFSNLNYEL